MNTSESTEIIEIIDIKKDSGIEIGTFTVTIVGDTPLICVKWPIREPVDRWFHR